MKEYIKMGVGLGLGMVLVHIVGALLMGLVMR